MRLDDGGSGAGSAGTLLPGPTDRVKGRILPRRAARRIEPGAPRRSALSARSVAGLPIAAPSSAAVADPRSRSAAIEDHFGLASRSIDIEDFAARTVAWCRDMGRLGRATAANECTRSALYATLYAVEPVPTPRGSGRIILLNGASSSGKSALAKALQEALDEPFLHVSSDQFVAAGMLPRRREDDGR